MQAVLTQFRNAFGRHRGLRALSLCMAFAMLFVTWPQLELHAHARGEHAHAHVLEHETHHHYQIPDGVGDAEVIHVHDASSFVWTLPSSVALVAAMPPAPWNPARKFDPGALAAPPPPHRPPIA